MKKYTAKLNGQVIGKRQSARVYTHAVIGTRYLKSVNVATDGGYKHGTAPVPAEQQTAEVLTWCGRLDLAEKQLSNRLIGTTLATNLRDVQIVPVEFTEVKQREVK